MSIKEKAISFAITRGILYLKKDIDRNAEKLIDFGLKAVKDEASLATLRGLKKRINDKDNPWIDYLKNLVVNTDTNVIKKLIPPFMNAVVKSYGRRKASMEKYECNIPWAILIDVTTACNLKCKGCWASDYSKTSQLTYEELNRIICEGKELGTYTYLYTGGEPLMRKKDLISICKAHPDCLFLTFTNGTLLDEAFVEELRQVGNMFPIISIEGNEETTDARRGAGTYQKAIAATKRLKYAGVPFGASLCCTSLNTEVIASDEYTDFLIDLGMVFAWYFNFVPVGNGSSAELMPSAEQRELLYNQIRKWRFKKGEQKPILAIDFFNDGEYVGGCVAAGKQYFHISPNGDCEPCVFAHYSQVNIKEAHILDALRSPLFMAYRVHQPFSDNMLRPCPVVDNPGAIKKMVHDTGAKSTDLQSPENVDDLFNKVVDVSKAWKVKADEIAEKHGFIDWRIRSVDIYNDVEAKKLRDFKEFE